MEEVFKQYGKLIITILIVGIMFTFLFNFSFQNHKTLLDIGGSGLKDKKSQYENDYGKNQDENNSNQDENNSNQDENSYNDYFKNEKPTITVTKNIIMSNTNERIKNIFYVEDKNNKNITSNIKVIKITDQNDKLITDVYHESMSRDSTNNSKIINNSYVRFTKNGIYKIYITVHDDNNVVVNKMYNIFVRGGS